MCVWKSSSGTCQICCLTYTFSYSLHTHKANICIHNNVVSKLQVLIVVRHQKQPFLNLNPGQEVGPYLFPVPVLFPLRYWAFEIVHPDNGATVGIVHCFVFFQVLLCFYDCPIKHERWCGLQPAEGWRGSARAGEGTGSFRSPWWVFFPSLPLLSCASSGLGNCFLLRCGCWNPESGPLAMMVNTWSDCSPVYIYIGAQAAICALLLVTWLF